MRLMQGRAGPAARYSNQFCRQLVKCIGIQRRLDDDPYEVILMNLEVGDGHEHDEGRFDEFIDDRSGKWLNSSDVRHARKKEIKTMETMTVYVKVKRSDAIRRGAKIIPTRWLDNDKGIPGGHSDVRSRWVAKEYATEAKDELYAATPALEGVKIFTGGVIPSNSNASKTPDGAQRKKCIFACPCPSGAARRTARGRKG